MYARKQGICSVHGQVEFVQRGDTGTWRCVPCRAEAVTDRIAGEAYRVLDAEERRELVSLLGASLDLHDTGVPVSPAPQWAGSATANRPAGNLGPGYRTPPQ